MKLCKVCVVVVAMMSAMVSSAEYLMGPGDVYTYRFTTLEAPPWLSPGLPPYDDYTFALNLTGDFYNKPPDDIRIRLYEDPDDLVPVHNIFGESVPNLSVTPSRIAITEVPGTLWFDNTGRIEVEVLTGSVNLSHMNIDLGPGQNLYSAYIETIPEPGSFALTMIGAAGLLHYRRARRRKGRVQVAATPKSGKTDEPVDVF